MIGRLRCDGCWGAIVPQRQSNPGEELAADHTVNSFFDPAVLLDRNVSMGNRAIQTPLSIFLYGASLM